MPQRGRGVRDAYILHPSSLILHPSSLILHPSSLILHPHFTTCSLSRSTRTARRRHGSCDRRDRRSTWAGLWAAPTTRRISAPIAAGPTPSTGWNCMAAGPTAYGSAISSARPSGAWSRSKPKSSPTCFIRWSAGSTSIAGRPGRRPICSWPRIRRPAAGWTRSVFAATTRGRSPT